ALIKTSRVKPTHTQGYSIPTGGCDNRKTAPVSGRNYLPRADLTASTNARALLCTVAQSFLCIASLLTSAEPAPRKTAPALIHSPAFLISTPPVGVSLSCGRGARMSLKYPGP